MSIQICYNLLQGEYMIDEKPKQVYLKNKDILAEIHNSKMSFCWKESKEFTSYDYIIKELKNFHNRKTKLCPDGAINLAKEARAARLSTIAHQVALAAWETAGSKASQKPKADDSAIDPKKIPTSDLVVRTMTFDHIPLAPAVTNSFTRVLNVEKRQRDIRDDMLQETGQTPSWTRQSASSAAHHAAVEAAELERLAALQDPSEIDIGEENGITI